MPINSTQLKTTLQKPYDRLLFIKEVLRPVFNSALEINTSLVKAGEIPTKSEAAVIGDVWIYGQINLDDGAEIICYEVNLQPNIRIEYSKVAIQHYVRKLLISGQAALINFVSPSYKNLWRLTLVAKDSVVTDEGIKEKATNSKRYTYLLGPSESCKTAAERFELLSTQTRIDLKSIINAFSVEKLSKAFFDEYTNHYENFIEYLTKSNYKKVVFGGDEKAIRDFTKKLLGRIVFLYFVQKKGWLGASDKQYKDGNKNFLMDLFNKSGANNNFYPKWLTNLFFDTLNNSSRNDDDFIMPDGAKVKIPFLNGGLFDKEEYDEKLLTFKSKLFHNHNNDEDPKERGFLDFLNAFNFTIYEDSPDEKTVAVDPEMLGHIFENLLEDNKDKGAFYTPKEIVHYMCQESLIEYLSTHLGKEYTVYRPIDSEQVEIFGNEIRIGQLKIVEEIGEKALNRDDVSNMVKSKDIDNLTPEQIKLIDKLLDNVKICDPAIGSGAFPMGLLLEIYSLKELIAYKLGKEWKPSEVKENIIQKSIYGVDIEKGAVDIARLRFWLSLVVDEEMPKPLPNLDYKIVVGDSLISKIKIREFYEIVEIDWDIDTTKEGMFGQEYRIKSVELLKNISEKQREYFLLDNKNKIRLADEIRKIKIDILINQLEMMVKTRGILVKPAGNVKNITELNERYLVTLEWKKNINSLKEIKGNKEIPFLHFDWQLDFPEILNPYLLGNSQGFDIVIGNPPYDVYEGKKKKDIEDVLQFEIYQKCKGGKINAYELFLAKVHEITKQDGIVCQIFQNSFLADNSSRNLREFYLKNENIVSIDSFPERDNPKKRVFESVKMSVCIMIARKRKLDNYTFLVRFWSDRNMLDCYNTEYSVEEIFLFDPKQLVILSLRMDEKDIFRLYYSAPKKYSDYFDCLEGELNMTFHKKYMTSDVKNPLIVKGAQIQRYYITNNPSQGEIQYVNEKKYLKDYVRSEKSKHHNEPRIAMQGISGVNDKIRIISTLLDSNIYCANSCNYIIGLNHVNYCSLSTLLGIFNSKLTNWIFRKSSTNSNVNCYEVNNLRLPSKPNQLVFDQLDALVNYQLFLNSESQSIVIDKIFAAYFDQIANGLIYEAYFPGILEAHNREISKHLGELPRIDDEMSDAKKIGIIKKVFDRLIAKDHPVRVKLEKMKEIEEIKIIEGKG